jgi:hypothetical protein
VHLQHQHANHVHVERQRLSVVGGVAAVGVGVPLSVDGLVGSHVDDLSLGLELDRSLLRLRGRGDGSGSNLGLDSVVLDIVVLGLSLGGLGRSRGLLLEGGGGSSRRRRLLGGERRLAALLDHLAHERVDVVRLSAEASVRARSLRTAHVELHVLVRVAGLGLDIVGLDVGDEVARASVPAGQLGAPGVIAGGLGTSLGVTSAEEEALLPGGAFGIVGGTVDVRDIKVVVVEARRVGLEEVLELGDGATLALLGLGDLDGDTDVTALGVLVVLAVGLARLEGDHLIGRAAVALVDGPEVDLVGAAVDDLGVGLAGVTRLVEGDCAPGGDSGGHDGGGGDGGDELHFCCLRKPDVVGCKDGEGLEIDRPKE